MLYPKSLPYTTRVECLDPCQGYHFGPASAEAGPRCVCVYVCIYICPHTTVRADYRQWGGMYWFQNTRWPYWSMLVSGDVDLTAPFFDMYDDVWEYV